MEVAVSAERPKDSDMKLVRFLQQSGRGGGLSGLFAPSWRHTHMHMHMNMHMPTHMHIHFNIHMHVHMHIHMLTHMHIHINIHMHMHISLGLQSVPAAGHALVLRS